jgi:hypothetical protein
LAAGQLVRRQGERRTANLGPQLGTLVGRRRPGQPPQPETDNVRPLGEHMAAFTVRQGKRYRASISLGLVERFATNEIIADRLRTAGFSDISVTGSGASRLAEALWAGADASAELPKQITQVVEL